MPINFNCLFIFLQREGIVVDESKFEYQIQSHPNFPDLLCVTDALSFFNIENAAIHVEFSNIDDLPKNFVTLLNNENEDPKFCFIEKKLNNYFYTTNRKSRKITISQLEKHWNGVVILVEKSGNELLLKSNKRNWILVLQLLYLISFFVLISKFNAPLYSKLFGVFPVFGLLLSVVALDDLFKAKLPFFSNFCHTMTSTSCTLITDSKKWKIFKIVNFSDLSITFFSFQLIAWFSFLICGSVNVYFAMQKFLLFAAIVFLLLSLYYQKFVEKKWCPICLSINAIVFLELFYLLAFFNNNCFVSTKSILISFFILYTLIIIWSVLKKLLIKQKILTEFQLKATRFIKNYDVFKNILLSKTKAELAFTPITLGNTDSTIIVTIISSPFCDYCKDTNQIMEELLTKHAIDMQIKLIFNVEIGNLDDNKKRFLRILMHSYLHDGEGAFRDKLGLWYENKDLALWLQKYEQNDFDYAKIDSIYNSQNSFCTTNGQNYSPAFFINNYEFPKLYERSNIEFFISDIIEDPDFN